MNNYLKKEWPFLLIFLISLIGAAIVYPYMPDQVPIHWNIKGEIDNYGSKAYGTFFLPVLNIILYVFFIVLPKFDPKRANYSKFNSSYTMIRYSLHIFIIIIYGITITVSLGYPVNIGKWVAICLAVLFIILGNNMSRIRHNYFVGFKFPWTLANEDVWKKTHQFGAKIMVLGGLIALIGAIFTNGTVSVAILMIGIFVPMIIVTIYSYLLFKKQ